MWTPELVGGHPAVDLVNTVSWRADPRRTVDRLGNLAELRTWLASAGLVTGNLGGDDPLEHVRELRESVHRLLVATVGRSRPSPQDLAAVKRAAVDARRHATLAADLPLRWAIVPRDNSDIPRLLALHAEELLSSERHLKALGRCEGGGCGWFFLDTSRSHTRRWCSAGDCGNRERARRHYARHRAGATER